MSRMAIEADVFILHRLPSRVQSLDQQSGCLGLHNWCSENGAVSDGVWLAGSHYIVRERKHH
jgi:hypothetical protein